MEYTSIRELSLDGGCVVFDFTNTIGSRNEEVWRDYLKSYSDFLDWASRQKLLSSKRFRELSELAQKESVRAGKVFRKIVSAREVLFALFSSLAHEKKPEKEIQSKFNQLLGESLAHLRFDIGPRSNVLSFEAGPVSLEEPLHAVLKSAFDVLTQEDSARIKECSACGWLFLDKTKNKKRRWCNMLDCGSKDKASRYYHRKKAEADNAS